MYSHVQQTPNPLAQDPAAVPPLFVHSDLTKNCLEKYFLSHYLALFICSFEPRKT